MDTTQQDKVQARAVTICRVCGEPMDVIRACVGVCEGCELDDSEADEPEDRRSVKEVKRLDR